MWSNFLTFLSDVIILLSDFTYQLSFNLGSIFNAFALIFGVGGVVTFITWIVAKFVI